MVHPHPDPLALLPGVSRSFYLSIRLLPAGVRAPVGLAYLLARTTDTVADSGQAEPRKRLSLLWGLSDAFEAAAMPPGLQDELSGLAGAQPDPQEAQLLRQATAGIEALAGLPPADQADVRAVLRHIANGQRQDLEQFPGELRNAAALEAYTYLVAGSVGEFWTDICSRHIPAYAALPHDRMRALGRSFGCGLQLVNIVRDAGEDLAAGRCYFPADEVAADGLEATWQRWQDTARRQLADGMAYADAVHPRTVRAAVALPAILGIRTLSLVRAAGPAALRQRVKVPRREVRAILLRMALTLAARGALRAEWENRGR